MKNIYPYCTSEEFKKDIAQLCENCPLTEKIKKGIKKTDNCECRRTKKHFDSGAIHQIHRWRNRNA